MIHLKGIMNDIVTPESPESPELRIDTSMLDPKDAIQNVMKYLEGQGLLDIQNDC